MAYVAVRQSALNRQSLFQIGIAHVEFHLNFFSQFTTLPSTLDREPNLGDGLGRSGAAGRAQAGWQG